MKKKIIPYHTQYAIEYEEKCIELRKKQIESYKKKIKLLKSGTKMGEVNKKTFPINSDFKYSVGNYHKLKRDWLEKNE